MFGVALIVFYFFQKQLRNAIILSGTTLVLILFRLYQSPSLRFSAADNPTARSPSFIVRLLTFSYLPVFNFGLLLFPNTLSFDWGMDAIPRLSSIRDVRALVTLVFYVTFISLILWCFHTRVVSREARRRSSDRSLKAIRNALAVRELKGNFVLTRFCLWCFVNQISRKGS